MLVKCCARTPVLLVMGLIIAAGGLVPVRTPLDRYASLAASKAHGSLATGWAKIKLGFAKVIGTSMTFLAPQTEITYLTAAAVTEPVAEADPPVLLLTLNDPRPPCC